MTIILICVFAVAFSILGIMLDALGDKIIKRIDEKRLA